MDLKLPVLDGLEVYLELKRRERELPTVLVTAYRTDEADSIDVFDPPDDVRGLFTMFDALHHFDPEDARRIFARAAASKVPIAVFDGTNRTAPMIVGAVFIPILVLLLTPLVRPFRWSRLLFT